MADQPLISITSGFLEPERIVRYFDLKNGDYVADFGSGHGFFTIPCAKKVGGDGKVFAVDIQRSTLEVIRAKAQHEHLLNIETIWGDLDLPEGSHLKSEFIDFVIISNILFQAEKKENLMTEAYRVLRKGGRLAVIEWDETGGRFGPPLQMRIKKEAAISLAKSAGFVQDKEFEAGSHHYGLLLLKQ